MHKITPSVYLIKHFVTKFNEPTNQNSTKVPKVLKPFKITMGTSVINSPMSPPSLAYFHIPCFYV